MLLFAASSSKSGSGSMLILIYLVVFGLFYFFYLRPRSKKQKAQRNDARKVAVGDRAQTIGGIVGLVTAHTDSVVTIQCDSGAVIDFVPSAIARRIGVEAPATADEAQSHEEGTSN